MWSRSAIDRRYAATRLAAAESSGTAMPIRRCPRCTRWRTAVSMPCVASRTIWPVPSWRAFDTRMTGIFSAASRFASGPADCPPSTTAPTTPNSCRRVAEDSSSGPVVTRSATRPTR